jgi:hypothetical protein
VRRVVVFLIALTVLAPSMAGATTLYRCGHSGELRDHCCCAHESTKRGAGPSEVRTGCCCETVHIDAPRTAERQTASVSLPAAATGPAVVMVALAEAKPRIVSFERPRDALAPPTPLFVAHCALLL